MLRIRHIDEDKFRKEAESEIKIDEKHKNENKFDIQAFQLGVFKSREIFGHVKGGLVNYIMECAKKENSPEYYHKKFMEIYKIR